MPSYANVTPTNLELSPMQVFFNSVDLGGTLSNVNVTMKYTKANLMSDQFGKTVLDRRVSATEITVTTEMAEILNKDNWKIVFPHAYEVTSGTKLINWVSAIGDSDLAHAQLLRLHPLSRNPTDFTEDFNFQLACASAESEIVYSPEGQSKLKVVWNILPYTGVSPAHFFTFGDPAVGVVNASFGSPTFTGTGNGVLSAETVFNGHTRTETITAVLVTASHLGGVFFVSGSLSGPLGLATVGVTFNSPQISFLISAGGTDFVLNDTFTLPTTAANYM